MMIPGFEPLNHVDNREPGGYDPNWQPGWTGDMLPLTRLANYWLRLVSVFPRGIFFSELPVVAALILSRKVVEREVLVYPPNAKMRETFEQLGNVSRVQGRLVVFRIRLSVPRDGELLYECDVRIYRHL